ncbi:3-(methylthio)propionyl-CoA ligase [Aureimonas mangrovi]|uniref:3-(methylthio)propionyl-CoA ligase n=1 Tax=Aureimonas mangrovi TaxID=2758041 RepID=UPI00163D8641|nr:3-(methylthio)propionyl-CoA ligase [Aureimonas mangrovi]
MLGMMMDVPLLVTSILRHAATYHGETEIVSRTAEGPIHRTTYAELWRRSQRVANMMERLGVKPGERVGTLAWNGFRHLELYYGVSGSGRVCHTINPRLFKEQIAYIVEHAQDRVIFADGTFLPLLESLADRLTGLALVIMTDEATMPRSDILPNLLCYETLLAAESEDYDWPDLDEKTASSLCYTSGTTGNPKGVLYSHRSTVLHAMASAMPDALALSAGDCVLPVVPMFHVNAWGLPYSAVMAGAKLVLPGPRLDGESLYELIEAEGVTFTAGVPTVWLALLEWTKANGKSFSTLKRLAVGGSAMPPVMIERFEKQGVTVLHAWGMTELSPIGTVASLTAKYRDRPLAEQLAVKATQGRPIYGVEFRVVDGEGHDVARDGVAFGSLLVRGPWVVERYYESERTSAHAIEGWFDTGDVVSMDPDGYVRIVDRSKDVIKSGGEWISSIDLENIAMTHPGVKEAAVVSRPDEKWGERPVLVVVPAQGASLSSADMAALYEGKIARWSVPEDLVVVEALPHTATGKLLKTEIRDIVRRELGREGDGMEAAQ